MGKKRPPGWGSLVARLQLLAWLLVEVGWLPSRWERRCGQELNWAMLCALRLDSMLIAQPAIEEHGFHPLEMIN